MWRPKKSAIAFVATVVVASSACAFARPAPLATPTPSRLFVTSEVMQNMFEMWREYENETVRCLTGRVANGTVYVMSMEPAWINSATPESTNFRTCTQEDVVGWFHLHPGYAAADGDLVRVCEFSSIDIATIYGLRLPVAVVACDENTIVWRYGTDFRTFKWQGEVPEPL